VDSECECADYVVASPMQQAADDQVSAAAGGPSTAEALHSEALQELAAVQAAATAAMVETTDLRRRNESLEAEVKLPLGGSRNGRASRRVKDTGWTSLHPLCKVL